MKSKTRRTFTISLCLILIFCMALPIFGADDQPALITGNGILWVGAGKSPVVAANLPGNAKSFTVESGSRNVLKVGKQQGFGPYGWWMQPVKAGKAKITLKYKTGSKSRKVSGTFTVKKYPDPFEYIKINGRKVDLKKNRVNCIVQNYKKKTITVNFKLKKGWKVSGLSGSRVKGEDWIDLTWKKNKAISLKGYDAADLVIDLKNKNTGLECDYEIPVSR